MYPHLKIMVNVCAFLMGLLIAALLFGCATNPRPWSTGDKLLLISSTVATGADVYTTMNAIQSDGVHEANPIYGDDPSDGQLIATAAAFQAFVVIVAHYYPSVRKFLLGLKTVASGGAAAYNSNVK